MFAASIFYQHTNPQTKYDTFVRRIMIFPLTDSTIRKWFCLFARNKAVATILIVVHVALMQDSHA